MIFALPWKRIAVRGSDDLVASVTRLRLARWRDVPGLLSTALRLRKTFDVADGGVAIGLAAEPLRRTFWTLTLWRDEAAVLAYVRSPDHADAMRAFRGGLAATDSARWRTQRRPTWREARRQLDAEAAGQRRARSEGFEPPTF